MGTLIGSFIVNNKERNFLYDNIKAVLITFVVAAHYVRVSGIFDLNEFNAVFYTFAFSFIMQGFFFISGFFSKKVDKCHNGAVENFLIPYIIFTILMYITRLVVNGTANLQFYSPTHGMWFFLNMFVYRYILKYVCNIKGIRTISFALYLFTGLFEIFGRTLSLGRIFSFFLFFIMGYFADEETFNRIRNIKKKYILPLFAASIALFSYLVITLKPDVELFQFREYFGAYGLTNIQGILFRLVLLIFTILFLVCIINLTTDKKCFMTTIGMRTLPIFVFHIVIRYVIKKTEVFAYFPLPVSYLMLILSVILTLYVFTRPSALKLYNTIVDYSCRPLGYFRKLINNNPS